MFYACTSIPITGTYTQVEFIVQVYLVLGLVMYYLLEDTGNIHAHCLVIMLPPMSKVLVVHEICGWC